MAAGPRRRVRGAGALAQADGGRARRHLRQWAGDQIDRAGFGIRVGRRRPQLAVLDLRFLPDVGQLVVARGRNPDLVQRGRDLRHRTLAGTADYIFTRNAVTSQHSIIELALDMDIFGGATVYDMYCLPSCGNDELHLSTQIASVPEPTSIALLGLGLLGIGLMRRRGKSIQ